MKFDHHCHYVDNCVGIGNRRLFVGFVTCAMTGTALIAVLAQYVTSHNLCPVTAADSSWTEVGVVSVRWCVSHGIAVVSQWIATTIVFV